MNFVQELSLKSNLQLLCVRLTQLHDDGCCCVVLCQASTACCNTSKCLRQCCLCSSSPRSSCQQRPSWASLQACRTESYRWALVWQAPRICCLPAIKIPPAPVQGHTAGAASRAAAAAALVQQSHRQPPAAAAATYRCAAGHHCRPAGQSHTGGTHLPAEEQQRQSYRQPSAAAGHHCRPAGQGHTGVTRLPAEQHRQCIRSHTVSLQQQQQRHHERPMQAAKTPRTWCH
jgi:hypothetical protein